MIRIKAKQKNFRRCGIAHDDQFVEHPDDRFTAEQLKVLQAEPMLIVEVVPEKTAPAGLEALTVEQLKAEIKKVCPNEDFKGVRKDRLILFLTERLEASGGAGAKIDAILKKPE